MNNQENLNEWFRAIADGDMNVVQRLHSLGMDVNRDTDVDEQSALHIAIVGRHYNVAEFLLEKGANIESTYIDWTPLMWASEGGDTTSVEFLLSHGVHVNLISPRGDTAYDLAKRGGNTEVMRILRRHGGNPNKPTTVLVTGAGFTRAFYSGAPTLVGDFGVETEILPKFERFPVIKEILESELRRQQAEDGKNNPRNVNLERLMTRISGGMPYDKSNSIVEELAVLWKELIAIFVQKIVGAEDTKIGHDHFSELARYCLVKSVDIVIFNYDNYFEMKLAKWSAESYYRNFWHPNTGYGFYCKAARELIGLPVDAVFSKPTKIEVFKLHGSLNWFLRLGASSPYALEDFVHHEDVWGQLAVPIDPGTFNTLKRIKRHIDRQPYIIPPILTKAGFASQPLLQLLWTRAFDLLRKADHIIFVGYSLPTTDIAAGYLFSEASASTYPDLLKVEVVDFAPDDEQGKAKQKQVRENYRKIYPDLPDVNFHFQGALGWAKDFVDYDRARLLRETATQSP